MFPSPPFHHPINNDTILTLCAIYIYPKAKCEAMLAEQDDAIADILMQNIPVRKLRAWWSARSHATQTCMLVYLNIIAVLRSVFMFFCHIYILYLWLLFYVLQSAQACVEMGHCRASPSASATIVSPWFRHVARHRSDCGDIGEL